MNKIIAVDFDGTLCCDRWPNIGAPNTKLINYLLQEKQKGARIILWTCRTEDRLQEAVNWCTRHNITLDAVNENLEEAIEMFGGDSRKIFAHEYIDDKNNTKFKLPFKKGDSKNNKNGGTKN